ncbi:MAG: hypothetical protein JSV89_02295, partial [Spirochaetaceae bacterium]
APVLFAVSTILTKDLYQLLGRNVRESRLFRVSRLMVLSIGAITIPLAVFLRGVILDTAYITYAIRSSAAVAVLLGIYWVRKSKPVPTALSVSTAMVASTGAAIGFVIFDEPIARLLGFRVDKVFAALFFSLFFILLITALSRVRLFTYRRN